MTRALFAMLLLAACGGGGNSGGDDSPAAICTTACDAELGCGLDVPEGTCVSTCESASTAYLSCAEAAGSDCNALASCAFAEECGGNGPSGTGSCSAAQDCENQCNTSDPTTSCACLCVAQMSEAGAVDLLDNNFCAAIRCAQYCTAGASFDGAMCNSCFADQCSDTNASCN
ncbi:MAG TPA: hypothetical protein VGM88_06960 [Kofleriaceae bacterium]|jgi:hypothetical protein